MHWYVRWYKEESHQLVRRENIVLIVSRENSREISSEKPSLIIHARCIQYNLKDPIGKRRENEVDLPNFAAL